MQGHCKEPDVTHHGMYAGPRSGTAKFRQFRLHFTTWTFEIWGKSRTKASFSHLQLSLFEGSLARKLRFHIFQFQFWTEVSHERASFSHLHLSDFEGSLARKLRFHIFHFHFLREVSRDMRFCSGCTTCCVLQDKTCPGRWMGKLFRRAVAETPRKTCT